jgi:hypothetical protein
MLAAILHIGPLMQVRLILFFLLLAQLGDAATFMVGEQLHGIGLESNGVAVAAILGAGLLVVGGITTALVLRNGGTASNRANAAS